MASPRPGSTRAKRVSKRARPRAARAKSAEPLVRLRAICLALPDVVEKEAWGTATFRAKGGMFVMFADDHHGDGRVAMWCKAPSGMQETLVGADPRRFFVPPYVGPQGWVGVRLDVAVDWDEVSSIVAEGYRAATRPKARARSTRRPT